MRNLLTLLTLLLAAALSPALAAETLFYTLDGTITASGGNTSSYAEESSITQNQIEWGVVGNVSINPWRIGGKSLSSVDRTVYSKTAMGSAISKIEVVLGSKTCTLNSLKLEVANNSTFSTILYTRTISSPAASTTHTFTPSSGTEWATGAYYRLTFNVTCGSSNQYIQLSSVKFYANSGSTAPAAPTFSPASGASGEGSLTVTMSSTTSGATIYYTTDDSTPTTSSSSGTSVTLSTVGSHTVKAIAVKDGLSSSVSTANYTVTAAAPAAPTFTPASGSSAEGSLTVTMSSSTSGATIYYTTDGSTPTTSSSSGTSVTLNTIGSHTVKAIAVKDGASSSVATATYTVTSSSSTETYVYTKVTSASELTSGQYLIVYEAGGLAFNGGLSTLDAVSNTISVTITDNTIESNATTDAASFTINPTAGTILSASGLYIHNTTTDNTIKTSNTAPASTYANSISITDGNADIVSNTTHLRYNNGDGQTRFRYYKSTSYSSQQPIALYKKTGSGTTPATYSITGIGTLTNGSVTASSASNIAEGTSVTLTVTPDTGYELATLTVDGNDMTSSVSNNTYTFNMPGHDVAVSATFSAISSGGSEQTATFIFNTSAGLAALGITEPTSSGAETDLGNNTYTVGDVTMSSTDGGTPTRIYNSSNSLSLRVYKTNGSLTYAVPSGYTITSIEITGKSLTNLSVSGTALTHGTDATWTGEAQSVTFTATDGATIYTVTVTYTAPGGGSTIATVEGIASFKDLTAGTKARLHLPDGYNARVLHVASGTGGTTDAYVRDNTGAILIKGLTPNRPMVYNQHLAGWITGEYNVDSNGVPMFVTGTDTNTAFLVIADPVTEEATEPKTGVTTDDLDDNLADWVVVKDIDTGDSGNPTITNAFNTTGYAAPYSGAIVDVSAIVAGSDLLYPVSENSQPVLTYVLDASKNFTSPTTAISGATVRLAREFSAGVWTPLTVPFTMSADDFDGTVMEYTGLTAGTDTGLTGTVYDAGFMQFTATNTITAGVPYMVKASDDITGLTVSNVTLSNTEAQTVTHRITASTVNPAPRRVMSVADEYSLVGTYSPTTVSTTDHTYKVITSSGTVGWADSSTSGVQGTGAYITSPAGQGVSLVMGDGDDSTITGITDIRSDETAAPVRIGIYNLMGVKMPDDWEQLPPGVYIVNGTKVIKQFNQ